MRVNERIRVPQVRLIDLENQQVGVINTNEALNMAREAGVDLVEVAPNSNPPVCRLMDYGKWKYEQKKKEHKAKVKQHNVTLKEVRLRPKIDKHDKDFKLKSARTFLVKGSKVQFTMMFRGREMMHLDLSMDIFNEIAEELQDVGKIESPARRHGRRMTMVMAPTGTGTHGKSAPSKSKPKDKAPAPAEKAPDQPAPQDQAPAEQPAQPVEE